MYEPKPHAVATSAFFPADNPAVTAHMNLLQGIINRLAGNSSSCKTWCLTLVASLLSLSGATHVPAIAVTALVPVVVFGLMDWMYLAHEVAYRNLFDAHVDRIHAGNYGLQHTFDAKASPNGADYRKALKSWAIAPIYGGLIGLYCIAWWLGWLKLLALPQVK